MNQTWQLILEDLHTNSAASGKFKRFLDGFINLSFQVMALYRLMRYFERYAATRSLAKFLRYMIQVISGCHIHSRAVIGRRCVLPHPTGVVIGEGVTLGDDVTLYQHVTLGTQAKFQMVHSGAQQYPNIGCGVVVYAGAMVLGAVSVGDESVLGAGAVVLCDVPPKHLAVGVPARILPLNSQK